MCWNLSLPNYQTPIYVINGHSDVIYDLKVFGNRLFSVSHDHHVRCLDVSHFASKMPDAAGNSVDYALSRKLYKDDSKYPLRAVVINKRTNEVIFGSRKASIFNLDTLESKQADECSFGGTSLRSNVSKSSLKCGDLDHIENLKLRSNLLMVQRTGINYVKLFNVESHKLVKKYLVEDGDYDDDVECTESEPIKYRIYDSGISFDRRYAILCVGVLNKENSSNLDANRSALRGFKIPKHAAK